MDLSGDGVEVIDEVLVSLFRKPRSYTSEDSVEISCHGSPYIQQKILDLLVASGARLAQPGEFTLRAFLKGRIDLSQAEAVADLIAAESQMSHRVALDQLRGGFSNKIKDLREKLTEFASLVELEHDFGEEDVEFANRDRLKLLIEEILNVVDELLRSFQLGNALRRGVPTVIAGRPNAGKSTLLNALLEEERAIVSDIPGTTRDTIEEVINVQGIQFRLIDTAGIRQATDTIEALGVQRTMEKVRQSSIVLYVFDVNTLSPKDLEGDLRQLAIPGKNLLVLANKMDLNPYIKPDTFLNPLISPEQLISMAARNGQNVPFLRQRLYELVIGDAGKQPDVVVSNMRHVEALAQAQQSLSKVLEGMAAGTTSDVWALDIRQTLHHLGEITGEISVDDLLGNIFSNFCIGK